MFLLSIFYISGHHFFTLKRFYRINYFLYLKVGLESMKIEFKYILIICGLFVSHIISGQKDSVKMVKYTPEYEFKEGIYLSFDQLKRNQPIPKSRIISSIDPNNKDFFQQLLTKDKIYVYDNLGIKNELLVKNIWGYCENGFIYISMSEGFHRISFVGSLCHFIADVTVYSSAYQDPYYNMYNNPYYYYSSRPITTKTSEVRQYILDFESGRIYEYTVDGLEMALMSDPQLYDEYMALSNKKKKELKFLYIRKYNDKNPLYLPANNE